MERIAPHTREGRVVALALASRLGVLALMAAADAAFPDLASSAHLQNFPCDAASDTERSHALSQSTFMDSMAPWDSVYFVRIAKCGYESDMVNAFFPLLPLVMRYGVRLTGLSFLEPWVPVESLYTAVGLAVNVAAFCAASLALYRLGVATLGDDALASLAVVLFCFNPASVFYSAVYSEALFAACTWTGLVLLPRAYWAGVGALIAAAAARSNGTLGCWFLLHACAAEAVRARKLRATSVLRTIIGCAVICAPYAAMQALAYQAYCVPAAAAPPPRWCSRRLPSVYAFIQEKYWDVGFLRFYAEIDRVSRHREMLRRLLALVGGLSGKGPTSNSSLCLRCAPTFPPAAQWPAVLQSVPVAFLAVSACWVWASFDWRRAFTLGLLPALPPKPRRGRAAAKALPPGGAFAASPAVAPYIYHLALMTAAALLVMHVNVATRFLSVSPALYWYVAAYLRRRGRPAAWVWLWCLAFIALGCLMFPNFYPWT